SGGRIDARGAVQLDALEFDRLAGGEQLGDRPAQLTCESKRLVGLGWNAFDIGPVRGREQGHRPHRQIPVTGSARPGQYRKASRAPRPVICKGGTTSAARSASAAVATPSGKTGVGKTVDWEGPPRAAAAAAAESAPRPAPSRRSRNIPPIRKPRATASRAATSPASANSPLVAVVSHAAYSEAPPGS